MIKAIDRLFKRLAATYPLEWERSLGSAPENDVKTVWAHELSQFQGNLHRIAWALENLPERCPNVIVFKNLCRQAPAPEEKALPEPKPDPARLAAELAKLTPLIEKAKATQAENVDFKAWAKAIMHDHRGGLRRTPTVVAMARRALGEQA